MITTVTTTTTATLNSAMAGSLGLIMVFALIVLLVQRELIAGLNAAWASRLSAALRVAIAPLMVVFAVSAALRIALLLS